MSVDAAVRATPADVRACTICRELPRFGLLAEEMGALMNADWGNLTPAEAAAYLAGPEARKLEFAALVLGREDEDALEPALRIVRQAAASGVPLILVPRDIGATALHRLISEGAAGFVPYPLPQGALSQSVERLRAARSAPAAGPGETTGTGVPRNGMVLPVHGLGGGVGATTFAVNLAWELATLSRKAPPRVCLIDLDLQFGSVATFLDLSRREAVYELLSQASQLDGDALDPALAHYEETLSVLTAPAEILPLDFVGPDDVQRLIDLARSRFDYVVIDMPKAVTHWTETVLKASHVYFALLELDMRSAQNALRLNRALKAEGLPHDRLRFVLNRAPGRWDGSGKSRAARLAETLGIALDVRLPDGGRRVADACDHGRPLADVSRRMPLRREIRQLARALRDLNESVTAAG